MAELSSVGFSEFDLESLRARLVSVTSYITERSSALPLSEQLLV